MDCLIAFACAFAMVSLVTLQTRQIVDRSPLQRIFTVALGINLVWGFAVRQVVLNSWTIPFYALGAACGSVVSLWLKDRMARQ